jgi:hypothetical protein
MEVFIVTDQIVRYQDSKGRYQGGHFVATIKPGQDVRDIIGYPEDEDKNDLPFGGRFITRETRVLMVVNIGGAVMYKTKPLSKVWW